MYKKILLGLALLTSTYQMTHPLFKAVIFTGLGAAAVVAYNNKDEIKTYAYGAYLKYWRLPYLKEDIAESLRTGKPLSEYSKKTIKMAIEKSPDFLALWLKDKLSTEQITEVVALFKQFLNPKDLVALTQRVWDSSTESLRKKAQNAFDRASQKFQKKMNELFS